ncbi:uncharacterized protein LOC142551246 isoform X1 [Primulina tabacum]|uniref:uncharacterized protein LOC142551246 isoform X1 n=1 Tax=Primulina tabacum TaxID=48773 RepID=UPI003F59068E
MDTKIKGVDSDEKKKILHSLGSDGVILNGECDVDDDSQLLLPSKKGGLLKKSGKPKRKVQWLDRDGSKLAEILEFQPSDVSDSDEEDSDSCLCRIIILREVLRWPVEKLCALFSISRNRLLEDINRE